MGAAAGQLHERNDDASLDPGYLLGRNGGSKRGPLVSRPFGGTHLSLQGGGFIKGMCFHFLQHSSKGHGQLKNCHEAHIHALIRCRYVLDTYLGNLSANNYSRLKNCLKPFGSRLVPRPVECKPASLTFFKLAKQGSEGCSCTQHLYLLQHQVQQEIPASPRILCTKEGHNGVPKVSGLSMSLVEASGHYQL